ncbi:MAG: 5-formyltetrahydrofolate cyclo-ligase [Planctomycetaceae bacterium]|nr:5-formyltetrahydrofolate cyclo-ligase [Planctomycetaceae bacterium]
MFSKDEIRNMISIQKQDVSDTREISRQVIARLMSLLEMKSCSVIMSYVDFGKEVRTVPLIFELLNQEKRVVVPYCENGEIQLFRIKNLKELAPGYFGILEPKIELRQLSERRVLPEELQLILVPGMAFDPQGGRLGRGKGFYDRFLKKTSKNSLKIGLAFDWQIFDAIPMSESDQYVDVVVTQNDVYFRNL